ncbi:MAG: D-alanyl-D-alanine carboxypeptidase family protein [Geminicoccaceae bacterium]
MRQLLCALLLLIASLGPAGAQSFETSARAAIVIDASTGDVLLAKNADERLPPASMSKLMTAYVVFDKLASGLLKLEDELPVSEKAWRTGGSKMFVAVGTRVPVQELLQGIIIQSGNDACIVVAEGLAGSEPAFADKMNEKATELGLTNSHFSNATGLDEPQHFMSVRDLATLARAIITRFPQFYKYYSMTDFTYNGIKQPNRNPLLQAKVPGVDGMKTGFTDEAGYGLVASAQRDGLRLIMVLAGLESPTARRQEGERVLEYAFREFHSYPLFKEGETIAATGVWMGETSSVALVADGTVAVTLSRDARAGLQVKLNYDNPVPAPVQKGQKLGDIQISAPGMPVRTVPLLAAADVPRAGAMGRLGASVTHLLGLGSGG